MENSRFALVLSGDVLPGFEADAVWSALAAYFRLDVARLRSDLLARAPVTIKESDDLAKLQALQSGAQAAGARTAIHPLDGAPALFVLIDNVPRGPVPRAYVEGCVAAGTWPSTIQVAEVGGNAWKAFVATPPPLPTPVAAEPTALDPAATQVFSPSYAERVEQAAADVEATRFAPAESMQRGDLATVMASPATLQRADAGASGGGMPPPQVAPGADAPTLPAGASIHAGFWRRCAAMMIDGMLLGVIMLVLQSMIGIGAMGMIGASGDPGSGVMALIGLYVLVTVVGFVGQWLYFALFESRATQATPGKMALGIKVTDAHGGRIGFGRATGRYFGKILSGLILYIGFLLAGWTSHKQALHDMLASTYVVFRGVQPGQPLPHTRPPMPWYGWLVNALLLAVFPLAILAAIALPAYQDYVGREKIAGVVVEASTLKTEVAEAVANGQGCPVGSRSTTNPAIDSIELGGSEPACTITLNLSDGSPVPLGARGGQIELRRDYSGDWNCSSTVSAKYLPPSCR